MSQCTGCSPSLLAAVLLAALALPVCAEMTLDLPEAALAAQGHGSTEIAKPERGRSRSISTLQVGCDDDAGPACRRAVTSVEIGSISRSNRAANGVAIQETLIGTAR